MTYRRVLSWLTKERYIHNPLLNSNLEKVRKIGCPNHHYEGLSVCTVYWTRTVLSMYEHCTAKRRGC